MKCAGPTFRRQLGVINLDVVNTIPKSDLAAQITTLLPARMADVELALRFAPGMK